MGNQLVRSERLAWAVLAGALILTGIAVAFRLATQSLSLTPVVLGNLMLAALSLLIAIRYRLARREEVETLNLRIYREEHPGTELFEDSDEALKMAARAYKAYGKIAAPVLAILAGGGILLVSILIWRNWGGMVSLPEIKDPARYGILTGVLFVAHFLAGSFYIGASREKEGRWLRPSGAWLFFTGLLWLVCTAALFVDASGLEWARFDVRMGYVGLIAVLILTGEMMVGVVIEFYRPRRVHEQDRPVFESRILALVTEPGGIARNVAASLDYQFGFKISERAFYRFLERSLLPLALLLVVILWLSTCLVVVDTEENGIRERFGDVVEGPSGPVSLGPGLYTKLPWPFGRINTFPVQRVQTLSVGYLEADSDGNEDMPPEAAPGEEMGDLTGRVIVWAKRHTREEVNFVVASRPDDDAGAEFPTTGEERVPVSSYFLSVSMPLFFKVSNLYDYAYKHADPNHILLEVAHEELAKYCAQVDFFDLLTRHRREAGAEVARRIQARADELELGIDVVFLGLHGVHPPVRVGSSFNEVVSAAEEMHTRILEAETDAVSMVGRAQGEAAAIRSAALSYTYDRKKVAQAEALRFDQQLLAYAASPTLYPLRSFLSVLEDETADIRKFIVTAKGGRETVILNLEEKIRADLLDINLDREE